MNDTFLSQTNCDRCHKSLNGSRTTSWFTEQTICIPCSKKERKIKDALDAKGQDTRRFEGCGYLPDC